MSDGDRRWAAEHPETPDYHTDEPTPDEVLERAAAEAAFLDSHERGFVHF